MENFILYDELAADSRSVVYKGRKKGSISYVAIICSDKTKRPEITNHVRLSHDLKHQNIVSFYEWYETSNHLWLVVELCTGGSLEAVIAQDGFLSEDVVRGFGRDLVRGLKHIHQSGIVFSDLTPAKILLDGPGVLKFSNLCLSKAEGETLEEFFTLVSSEETGEGAEDISKDTMRRDRGAEDISEDIRRRTRGDPVYCAPEVLLGAESSCQSDLWALGCILYYIYTGVPPFYSDSLAELTEMIVHQDHPPPRQPGPSSSPPSEEFHDLLRGLLTKSPEHRMDWPELLAHPFWTAVEEDEDEDDDDDGGGEDGTDSAGSRPPQTADRTSAHGDTVTHRQTGRQTDSRQSGRQADSRQTGRQAGSRQSSRGSSRKPDPAGRAGERGARPGDQGRATGAKQSLLTP